MSLSDQDLAAVAQVMDGKLAAFEKAERKHRRFWILVVLAVLVVLILAIAALAVYVLLTKAQLEVDRVNQQFSATKLAYQRQVEENQQLKAERKKAEQAVAYDSTKTQAEHEAGLLGDFFSLLSSKAEFDKKYDNADMSDPKVMEAYARDLNKILNKGLNPLGQVMLRNTDPAHNSPDEQLRSGDVAKPTAPLIAPGEQDPAAQPAPARETPPQVAPPLPPAPPLAPH